MAVRVDLNISLDGFATTADQTPENPMGEDWSRLVAAYVATRTFRERVLHDASGEGTTGVDDDYAQAYFAEVGAEIMGAGMFGLHNFPDDPDWRGWWGDEPPFHVPVFVLTHTAPRPSIEMADGTTFHFLSATPTEALSRALAVADGKDVRVGGGPSVVRGFLKAGIGAFADASEFERLPPREVTVIASGSLFTLPPEVKVIGKLAFDTNLGAVTVT